MRTILFCLFAGVAMAQAQNSSPAQQAELIYRKGVEAEKAGNTSLAQQAYAQALQLNPNHPDARYRAGELKRNAGAIQAKAREGKFGQVIISQIVLEGASLQDALDALRLGVEKSGGADSAPNFIIEDPDKVLDKTRISLQLKGIPAKGVLEYILSQSGAKARYDEHAVVILPRSGAR